MYENLKTLFETFREEKDKSRQPAYVSALLGGSSKIIASTLTYPYQVIKSRLQQREQLLQVSSSSSSNLSSATITPRYNGTLDCMTKIMRNEGVAGFFRGVIPNALKVAPSAALTFLVYEECMLLLKKAAAGESSKV